MIDRTDIPPMHPRPHVALAFVLTLSTAVLVSHVTAHRGSAEDVTVPGHPGAVKSSADERAARRAYDGAPPVMPHQLFGAACGSCHTREGMAVDGVGFAPASPHAATAGMSAMSRCQQCHVLERSDTIWRESTFTGLRQDLRHGPRLHPLAPPVMPHDVFMRENCMACHTGPAAREEIRTSHPERTRCQQCHLEQRTTAEYVRSD